MPFCLAHRVIKDRRFDRLLRFAAQGAIKKIGLHPELLFVGRIGRRMRRSEGIDIESSAMRQRTDDYDLRIREVAVASEGIFAAAAVKPSAPYHHRYFGRLNSGAESRGADIRQMEGGGGVVAKLHLADDLGYVHVPMLLDQFGQM